MSVREAGTPGGARLRALRESAGRTQQWVELEAGLGSGYLQRVESGRVAQPVRPTLERILTALAAGYNERREILELFGYTVVAVPPDASEIAWACEVCRYELDAAVFPAYVLDCTNRMIVWNQYVPRLFGVAPDDPRMEELTQRPLPALWFDPTSLLAPLVVEPDVFLPALIRALRYELQQVRAEAWSAELLRELIDSSPYLRHYWQIVEQEPPQVTAARSLVPVRLAVPNVGVLEFRLSSEPFVVDARFRAVYYLPADPDTMRQCAQWASDAGHP